MGTMQREECNSLHRRRIVFGTTVPVTARFFLVDQMKFLVKSGWEVHLVTSAGRDLDLIRQNLNGTEGITLHEIQMERRPSVRQDMVAMLDWVRLLRALRPDVIVVGTPKAGLLGILAAKWAGIKNRVYLVHGLRLEGMLGLRVVVASFAEWVACTAATQVVSVSSSLKTAMVNRHLVKSRKCRVIQRGSANGVDLVKFYPPSPEDRVRARFDFGLRANSQVIGFAGRLTTDKGICDLLVAMQLVRSNFPEAHLLVAGAEDATTPLPKSTSRLLDAPGIIELGHFEDMPKFFHALDIFCLPSYREGMPTVNLEASASGIAVVTTPATGCIDSIIDGETGRLSPLRDPDGLAQVLCQLLGQPSLSARMGSSGRVWAESHFGQSSVWEAQLAFLDSLVNGSGSDSVSDSG